MKITYNKNADAVYIYLISDSEIKPGWVKETYPCDLGETGSMINLDFNQANQLAGIEILDASIKLPKELLEKAEVIDN